MDRMKSKESDKLFGETLSETTRRWMEAVEARGKILANKPTLPTLVAILRTSRNRRSD